MIWIVVTDSTYCRIYKYQKKPVLLKLIKEMNHSESRLKRKFLTTDRPGHYNTKDAARGAYSPRTDPKEVEVNNFARKVARVLIQGRKKKLYEGFILIAPPHINGLLLNQVDKQVEHKLMHNIPKDYLHTSDQDLLRHLREIFLINSNR